MQGSDFCYQNDYTSFAQEDIYSGFSKRGLIIGDGECLNGKHVLYKELTALAGISNTSYQYWRGTVSERYESSRYLFLQKQTIPEKYLDIVERCANLDGLIPVNPLSRYLSVNQGYFVKGNNSLYGLFEYTYIQGIKFVKFKKFMTEHGISAPKGSVLFMVSDQGLKQIDIKEIGYTRISKNWGVAWY